MIDSFEEINRSIQLGYVPDNSESPCIENYHVDLYDKIENMNNLTPYEFYEIHTRNTNTLHEKIISITGESCNLHILDRTERLILEMRSGITLNSHNQEYDIYETARSFSMSIGRVKQIELKSLLKLKKYYVQEEKILSECLNDLNRLKMRGHTHSGKSTGTYKLASKIESHLKSTHHKH